MPRLLVALLQGGPALADESAFCGQTETAAWALQVKMVVRGVRRAVLLN